MALYQGTSYQLPFSTYRGLVGVFSVAIAPTTVIPVVVQIRKVGTFPLTSTESRGSCHLWRNCPYESASALRQVTLHCA
jgi:hypothetical protein